MFPKRLKSVQLNLLAGHISDYLNINSGFCAETDSIQIYISGDGENMTNNFDFIVFAILQTSESVMSHKGNRTIRIVNGKEDYKTIKESFSDIISEINQFLAARNVNIDSTNVNVEFFLGGYYKSILMRLG